VQDRERPTILEAGGQAVERVAIFGEDDRRLPGAGKQALQTRRLGVVRGRNP
jgi:hypothetical protein